MGSFRIRSLSKWAMNLSRLRMKKIIWKLQFSPNKKANPLGSLHLLWLNLAQLFPPLLSLPQASTKGKLGARLQLWMMRLEEASDSGRMLSTLKSSSIMS